MKKILLLTFLLVNLYSFSQTDLSWYRLLKGKIDKYPVTLHLYKAGHGYAGYYYYDSKQRPIYFAGDDTSAKGKIQLTVFNNSDEPERFVFTLTPSSANGDWKKTEKSKPMIFSAVEANMPVRFNYVFTTGSTKLRPKWKESPEANYDAASVWPLEQTATDNFLKSVIRKSFNKNNTTEDIGALMLKKKRSFLSSYLRDNKDLKDADLKQYSFSYNLDEDDKMLICFQSSKILSLAFSTYSYTGGAHGNYGTSYTAIDFNSNKILSLDDIITADGKNELRELLEKNFRLQFNLQPTDSLSDGGLFENKIEPNDNFYITGKGIGFCYNPYEIGPYAMGEIDIFIPFTDLKNYLKENFKNLIE